MLSNELLQLLKPPMALEDLGVSNRLVSDIAFRILFNEGDASVVRFVLVAIGG